MANFTLNSLGTQTVKDDDNLLKSDVNGVLSKASMNDLKQYVTQELKNDMNVKNNQNPPINAGYFVNDVEVVTTGTEKKVIKEIDFNIPVAGRYYCYLSAPLQSTGGSAHMTLETNNRPGNPIIDLQCNVNTNYVQISDVSYAWFEAGNYKATVSLWSNVDGAKTTKYLTNKVMIIKA